MVKPTIKIIIIIIIIIRVVARDWAFGMSISILGGLIKLSVGWAWVVAIMLDLDSAIC